MTERSDVALLMEQDLGPPPERGGRHPFWHCPFHEDAHPSLTVTPDHQFFKCFGCGGAGDDVDWLMKFRGLDCSEAFRVARGQHAVRHSDCRRSGKGYREPRQPARRATPRLAQNTAPPGWDPNAALRAVQACEAALWGAQGHRARDWLSARGIREETARAWRLGCNPQNRTLEGLWLPRGIVIPCLVGPEPWYIKVRRPVPLAPAYDRSLHGPKYQQVKGSRPAPFGAGHLTAKAVVTICEAELDAVLLWQEAHDLVDVLALGSKTSRPDARFLAYLARASRWLLALDRDADEAAEWWLDRFPRARRAQPLKGNDLTEFHQAGGDLHAWVRSHLRRLEADRSAPRPATVGSAPVRRVGTGPEPRSSSLRQDAEHATQDTQEVSDAEESSAICKGQ